MRKTGGWLGFPAFIISLLTLAYPKDSISQGDKPRIRLGRWLHPELLPASGVSGNTGK